MKLLIVESPNKTKKINGFLGNGWKVVASVGHISDMEIGSGIEGLGLKDAEEFNVNYAVEKANKPRVKKLKDMANEADEVYLATDPDREGEAIANQLRLFLKLKSHKRVSFNEISEKAVKASLEHPGLIDEDLVSAQEARRIIDRVYGFKGSSTAKRYDKSIKSVGRVQSAGLLLVVKREEEIDAFTPVKYKEPILDIKDLEFTLKTNKDFTKEELIGTSWDEVEFPSEIEVETLDKTSKKVSPPKPLSTNLALKLGSKLGYRPKETTKLLQSLFESGMVTYIRTDSINLSKDFKEEAKVYVENEMKLPTDISREFKLGDLAQEGHEAIRPVHIEDLGDGISDSKQQILYKEIRRITIASILEDGMDIVQSIETKLGKYTFANNSKAIEKEGFRSFWGVDEDKYSLNSLESGKYPLKVQLKDKTTTAPPRYSESSFLSTIEREGIGRPSTYSSMLQVILDREYVKVIKKQMIPTKEGKTAIKFLRLFYPTFIDLGYTREMESKLDLIAKGSASKKEVLAPFWDEVNRLTKKSLDAINKVAIKKFGACPKCSSPLRQFQTKGGKALGCTNYPNCKYIKFLENNYKSKR